MKQWMAMIKMMNLGKCIDVGLLYTQSPIHIVASNTGVICTLTLMSYTQWCLMQLVVKFRLFVTSICTLSAYFLS